MNLFTPSLVVLWMLVLLQALALMVVLRQLVAIKSILWERNQRLRRAQLSRDTPAPAFAIEDLTTGEAFANTDLMGQSSMLLFIAPDDVAAPTYRHLAVLVRPFEERAEGPVIALCRGSRAACRQLVEATGLDCRVLLDAEGEVAHAFKIEDTPQAVHLDDQTRVVTYGTPQQAPSRRALLATGESTGLHSSDSPG